MAVQKLSHVEPQLVEAMLAMAQRQTPEAIQERFGIGINTWTKIKRGQPVRESVVTRLVERVERQLAG